MLEQIPYAWGESSLGDFIAATSATGLVAFELGDQHAPLVDELYRRFPDATIATDMTGLREIVRELIAVVDDPGRDSDLALDLRGADFDKTVWRALREIPAGRTVSFSDVAARLGPPCTARDVGEACAANHIAILVPCHRVVRRDGSLAGYRWGVKRKRALLAREQADARGFPHADVPLFSAERGVCAA
jgi:AraC family transcriptional regulator, regulatory protein of adaptative response / methylated-DNA-[protein]-cysteine methyltransferase